jgi:hypothetical protein
MVTRALAYQMKAFIINAVSTINDEMLDLLPVTQEDRAYMSGQGRGSSIIGPSGEFLAGPMGSEEGILCAEVDLGDLVSPKVVQDFAGHYNRFDLLSLSLTRTVPASITTGASASDYADAWISATSIATAADSEISSDDQDAPHVFEQRPGFKGRSLNTRDKALKRELS